MRFVLAIILCTVLLAQIGWAAEQPGMKDQKAKDSYSLGYEFGGSLHEQAVEVDRDLLFKAISDALDGNPPALNPQEIRETLTELKRKVAIAQEVRNREDIAKNLEAGRAFMVANKLKEGVKTLHSGLQYKVIKEGNGPIPKTSDRVRVNYRGTLIDGTEFDSSYKRGEPIDVRVTGVIPGWTEALQLMKTGSKWQIYVPASLAYGERRTARIPPSSTLIFDIELLSIVRQQEAPMKNTKPAGN